MFLTMWMLCFREDRQIFLSLQEECKQMKSEIRRLDAQCTHEMEKRFGEGVTFADIDAFAVNRSGRVT